MSVGEDFVEWLKNIGTDDPKQGYEESVAWAEERGWRVEEMQELFQTMVAAAVNTAIAEENLLAIGENTAYYAMRFGMDLEAKKHLPSL